MAEYCTDLYTERIITRFIGFYKEILRQCLNEKQLIKDIMILNEIKNPKVFYPQKTLQRIPIDLQKQTAYEAPINETEKIICEHFSKLLHTNEIDRNSHFFDLGGTSLNMITFLSEKPFTNISAPDFIAHPTPAELARLLLKKQITDLQFTKQLHDAKDGKKALILIPYAAGGAESYASFVNNFTNLTSEYSIYYVNYLHSYEECEAVCEELGFLSTSKDLYLYSHCAGAAVAMQLIQILESQKKDIIKHYISGGFIPPTKTENKTSSSEKENKRNIWHSVPNSALKAILTKAGAPLQNFSKEEVKEMLTRFRQDTDFLTAYFSQSPSAIHCPVSAIISKRDIFTINYKKAESLWRNYAINFHEVRFIDTDSHYFQADNCTEFSQILFSLLESQK